MSTGDFFTKGFELYPAAAQTVTTFQAELLRRARGVLDARQDWGRLKATRRSDVTWGSTADGWRISVSHNGAIAGKSASVEVGYWWDPPNEDRKPVVFVALWGLLADRDDVASAGATSFKLEDRNVLTAPMPRDLDAQKSLTRLLDIVHKSLLAK